MAWKFTPVYTANLTGANVNPLPSPWGLASPVDDVTALQILGNKCTGVGPVPPSGAVSAMFYGNPGHAPDYDLIPQPCYGQVTIANLNGFVNQECSIDIILCGINPTSVEGYSFEISRNTEYGGYHFDCTGGYGENNLIFSQDFNTAAPKAGDVIQCFVDGTTAGVYLNNTFMLDGTLPQGVPSSFHSATFLQINCGQTIGDPAVSQFVVGTTAISL